MLHQAAWEACNCQCASGLLVLGPGSDWQPVPHAELRSGFRALSGGQICSVTVEDHSCRFPVNFRLLFTDKTTSKDGQNHGRRFPALGCRFRHFYGPARDFGWFSKVFRLELSHSVPNRQMPLLRFGRILPYGTVHRDSIGKRRHLAGCPASKIQVI